MYAPAQESPTVGEIAQHITAPVTVQNTHERNAMQAHFTIAEVCEKIHKTQPTVLGYIKSGKLSGEKGMDGKWYVTHQSLDTFTKLNDTSSLYPRVEHLEAKVEKLTMNLKVMLAALRELQAKILPPQ